MPRKFAVADCETDPFKIGRLDIEPFLWIYHDGTDTEIFHATEDFVDFIACRKEIVYIHNGGKFDIHFLKDQITLGTNVQIINNRIASVFIGECELRDSYNLLPIPLAAYKKDEIGYDKFEKECRQFHMEEIIQYAIMDCKYLYEMVAAFIFENGLNLTLAGSSLKAWQKLTGIKPPKTTAEFYDAVKPHYYGGRTQAFCTGVHLNVSYFDINSAYPYAMKHSHPYGDYYDTINDANIYNVLPTDFVTLNCRSKGALPYPTKEGLQFFDDDEIRTYNVTGHEIVAALATNTIDDISCVTVKRFAQFISFNKYVDYYYNRKQKEVKNSAKYWIAKLMLNSLYGKFGANPRNYWEYYATSWSEYKDLIADGWDHAVDLGEFILMARPIDQDQQRFYNVATAASITGFVRAYLWQNINIVGKNNVLYCDTDSLILKNFGEQLINSKELGKWSREDDYSAAYIVGKKLYALDHKIKDKRIARSKGVRLTFDEITRITRGETVTYYNHAPTFSIRTTSYQLKRTIGPGEKSCAKSKINSLRVRADDTCTKNTDTKIDSLRAQIHEAIFKA